MTWMITSLFLAPSISAKKIFCLSVISILPPSKGMFSLVLRSIVLQWEWPLLLPSEIWPFLISNKSCEYLSPKGTVRYKSRMKSWSSIGSLWFMIIPAVVCGEKTRTCPSRIPEFSTISSILSVISMNSIWLLLFIFIFFLYILVLYQLYSFI